MSEEDEIQAEWATCPQANLHNWPRKSTGERRKSSRGWRQEKCPGCGRYLIWSRTDSKTTVKR
jgi:hypothetical protein